MYKNLNMGALGHNVPFDEVVKLAQRHHFAGVDLDLTYLAALSQSQGLQQAKAWFAATGLRASAFGLQVAWREWDSDEAYADSLQKLVVSVCYQNHNKCLLELGTQIMYR